MKLKQTRTNKATAKDEPIITDGINRRDFFRLAWKGFGLIALIEVVGVIGSFLFSAKSKRNLPPKQLMEAGLVDSFGLNTVTAFMGGRFYLARQSDGGFIALSLRCTHLGCSILWEEEKQRFICPCHSSAFAINGEVMNAPAARALDYYPVLIENEMVKVDIGTIRERSAYRKDQLIYA